MPDNPDYTASMLPACIAAVEARLKLCDAATAGPWEVLPKFPASYNDPGYRHISTERNGKRLYANADNMRAPSGGWALGDDLPFIADARTGYPALLRMELARLREHAAAEQEYTALAAKLDLHKTGSATYDYWFREYTEVGGKRTQLRRDTARCWAQMQGGRHAAQK